MCYKDETNSIQLCGEHSVNSRMLSVDCRYIKENSHTIRRVDLLPQWMPNSVRMYHAFCLVSHPHTSFTFTFRCKPGFTVPCSLKRCTSHRIDVVFGRQSNFSANCMSATYSCYPSQTQTSIGGSWDPAFSLRQSVFVQISASNSLHVWHTRRCYFRVWLRGPALLVPLGAILGQLTFPHHSLCSKQFTCVAYSKVLL